MPAKCLIIHLGEYNLNILFHTILEKKLTKMVIIVVFEQIEVVQTMQ